MAVSRERFESGLSYEQYRAKMTRNRERFEELEQRVEIAPADLAAFQALPSPLHVLVLAEDWCGDVINNLPVLGWLAAESGTLDLRVFLRDQNLDLTDQYLNQGKYRSIPVFVFFDDRFNQVGVWIERPQSVTDLREQKRLQIYRDNPEFGDPDAPIDQIPAETRARLQQAIAEMREQTAPFSNAEVIRELREIVERVPANA